MEGVIGFWMFMTVVGVVGVLWFWIFMIVAVVKWGDVKRARASAAKPAEIIELDKRLGALEAQINSMNTQMLDLKDGHDFTLKLLQEKQGIPAKQNQ